jgi:hypothetical protein
MRDAMLTIDQDEIDAPVQPLQRWILVKESDERGLDQLKLVCVNGLIGL